MLGKPQEKFVGFSAILVRANEIRSIFIEAFQGPQPLSGKGDFAVSKSHHDCPIILQILQRQGVTPSLASRFSLDNRVVFDNSRLCSLLGIPSAKTETTVCAGQLSEHKL